MPSSSALTGPRIPEDYAIVARGEPRPHREPLDAFGELAFRQSWLKERFGLRPSRLELLEAMDDAMASTIESGDLLLIDTEEPLRYGNGIYVLGRPGEWVLKRVQFRVDGSALLSNDNERYPDKQAYLRTELPALGRVVWIGGRV